MMQKLDGTVQPCTKEDGDEFPEKVILGGASTKESYLAAHTNTHNVILVPSRDSIRQMVCHLMMLKN